MLPNLVWLLSFTKGQCLFFCHYSVFMHPVFGTNVFHLDDGMNDEFEGIWKESAVA
jgi:hypothetical protein